MKENIEKKEYKRPEIVFQVPIETRTGSIIPTPYSPPCQ